MPSYITGSSLFLFQYKHAIVYVQYICFQDETNMEESHDMRSEGQMSPDPTLKSCDLGQMSHDPETLKQVGLRELMLWFNTVA